MLNQPKWILFDIGGVLFNFKAAFSAISQHLNLSEEQIGEKIYEYLGEGELGNIQFEKIWQEILLSFQKQDEHKKLIELWWDVKHWAEDTKLLLIELAENGYQLGAFTNNWLGMGEIVRKEVPLFAKFYESSLVKLRKPDRAFYEFIEKDLNESGNNIFFIDDNQKNLDTAKEFHWQTYLYELGDDEGKTANNTLRQLLLR